MQRYIIKFNYPLYLSIFYHLKSIGYDVFPKNIRNFATKYQTLNNKRK